MIHSLAPGGRVAAVAPHGVLFRGASEGIIRRKVIEENLLDAVIGLPENLFFGTTIPACILVFKKNRANTDILFIDASGNSYPAFYKYVVTQRWFKEMLDNISPGGAGRNRVMNKQAFLKLDGIAPPIDEQKRIAEILSLWDKGIGLKGKLVEEKKRQKKWLMQKLLNPESSVRLPGFNGKWETVKLGDLGEFKKGKGITSTDLSNEGLPCIMYGDIYVKYNTFFNKVDFRIDPNKARNSTKVRKGDLLFTTSGETAEEIGKCVTYQGEEDIYIGGDIIAFTPNKDHSLFLSYQQNSFNLIKQKAEFGQGHSVVHIYAEQLKDLNVCLPSFREQSAIADIFYTADKEIELLEKELEETKKQKKALMQLLLTGLVRVV